MLKFFVVALLLCKASSYALYDYDEITGSQETNTDNPPTTEDYLHGLPDELNNPTMTEDYSHGLPDELMNIPTAEDSLQGLPDEINIPPPTPENNFQESHGAIPQGLIIGNLGYKEIKGLGQYKVHYNKLPWNEANRICNFEGGNLLVIRTIFEAIKVIEMLPNRQSSSLPFWVGIHQVRGFHSVRSNWKTIYGDYLTYDFTPPRLNRSGLYSRLVFGRYTNTDQCGLLLSSATVFYAEVAAPCIYPAAFICKREP